MAERTTLPVGVSVFSYAIRWANLELTFCSGEQSWQYSRAIVPFSSSIRKNILLFSALQQFARIKVHGLPTNYYKKPTTPVLANSARRNNTSFNNQPCFLDAPPKSASRAARACECQVSKTNNYITGASYPDRKGVYPSSALQARLPA